MDVVPRFVVNPEIDRAELTEGLFLELSIVGRRIWTEDVSPEAQVEAFKWLNEALHDVSNVQRNPNHPVSALAEVFEELSQRSPLLDRFLPDAWDRASTPVHAG